MRQREIKFRAWDSKLKMWCYGGEPFTIFGEVLLIDGFSSHLIENPLNDNEDKYIGSLERLNDIELMQFTGLKDKNGKEIYEGDIVQNIVYDGTKFSKFQIFWDEYSCSFRKIREDGEQYQLAQNQLYLCVIGNIFENPDLITVNK